MQNERSFDPITAFGFLILPLTIVFGLWFAAREPITKFALYVSPPMFEFAVLNVPPFLIPAGQRAKMAALAVKLPELDPDKVAKSQPWEATWSLMSLWGYILRPVIVPLLLLLSALWFFNVPSRLKYREQIKLLELAKLNAKAFPCLWPSIRAEVFRRDPFVGTWKMPLTTIEFVMKHGLLVYKKGQKNELRIPPQGLDFIKRIVPKRRAMHALDFEGMKEEVAARNKALPPHEKIDISGLSNFLESFSYFSLDEAKCDQVFRKQIGKPWKGLDALPPLEKALAICFMGIICGGAVKRKALKFMDQISESFLQAEEDKDGNIVGESQANLKGIDALRRAVENHSQYRVIKKLISSHHFEHTVFMRLLSREHGGARHSSGKVTPLLFHWLKPHNEALYRVLHKVDAQRPWVEGQAAFTHYYNEIRLGQAIPTPVIEGATASIVRALHDEEWIRDEELARQAEVERREVLDMLKKADDSTKPQGGPAVGPHKTRKA